MANLPYILMTLTLNNINSR